MKGNAARLCATAVAVAAVVGGVTFAAPAEAATSGLCNLSGTENIFGRQIWCKWSTGGKYVSITLSNASKSKLRCTIDGSESSAKTYDLFSGSVNDYSVERDPDSSTRVDIDCTSLPGESQQIHQKGSFSADPPADQTGGCSLSGTGSRIGCSWKADATTINVTITNNSKSRIDCKIDGSESSAQNYTWKLGQSGYVGVKRDADRTTTVSIDCKNYSGEPEQVQKTGSFSVARAS